jgi:hypothetical protein
LHLAGDDFYCRALFAFRTCPLPGLQPAFQVNVPSLIQIFATDLSQPTEADDMKPLNAFPGRPVRVFPSLIDRKAKRTDGVAFRAELIKARGCSLLYRH